jgi:hypothetical protein
MSNDLLVGEPDTASHRNDSKSTELRSLVREITDNYPDLKAPSEGELKYLEAALERVRGDRDTTTYIVATVAAVFLLLSFPMLAVWGYKLATSVQVAILPYLNQGDFLRVQLGVSTGLVLAASGAFLYALVMHISVLFAIPRRYFRSLTAPWDAMAKNNFRFRLYQVAMVYFALAIAILYVHSFAPELQTYSAFAARIWIFLPGLVLSIFPTIVLILLFVVAFIRERSDVDSTHAAVLREVLLLLQMLKNASHPRQLVMSTRIEALKRISKASSMFRRLYAESGTRNRVALWAQTKMSSVADSFLVLGTWILFPREDSILCLRQRLVVYANLLIAGNLNDLPVDAEPESLPFVRESRRRGYLHRLGSLMWLLLLVILPLLTYLAVCLWVGHTLPDPLQTPAAIAYSAWVGACLLAHIEDLAPEAKNTLIDVVKLILRR